MRSLHKHYLDVKNDIKLYIPHVAIFAETRLGPLDRNEEMKLTISRCTEMTLYQIFRVRDLFMEVLYTVPFSVFQDIQSVIMSLV